MKRKKTKENPLSFLLYKIESGGHPRNNMLRNTYRDACTSVADTAFGSRVTAISETPTNMR